MTRTKNTGTAVASAPSSLDPITDDIIGLTFDWARAGVADPAILDEIPNGCTLVLVPDGADQAFVETNLTIAMRAARRGRNVYIRHLAPGEWSAGPEANGSRHD